MTIELLNIHCMQYMLSLPDKCFDLAIVDPPYGLGTKCIKNNKNRTKLAIGKDYRLYPNSKNDRPAKEYFVELDRVSKNQIIWGANHLCDLFEAASSGWIVWDKKATGPFSDCELAYSSFNKSLKRFTYQWNGMLQGGFGDKSKNEVRIHPSQKPVKLYQWLLENYAEPGQNILDTHLGSGSSAIAAHYFGVDFVGCEIDETFFHETLERFDRETAQVAINI